MGENSFGNARGNPDSDSRAHLLFWIIFVSVLYFTLRAPLRRQAQASLFLDLLDSGIREGRSPEQTVVEIADSEDRTFRRRFHKVAEYIRGGLRLGDALELVPGFLPPRVVTTLQAGEASQRIRPDSRGLPKDADLHRHIALAKSGQLSGRAGFGFESRRLGNPFLYRNHNSSKVSRDNAGLWREHFRLFLGFSTNTRLSGRRRASLAMLLAVCRATAPCTGAERGCCGGSILS